MHLFQLVTLVCTTIAAPILASSFDATNHFHRAVSHQHKRGPGGWNSVQYPTGAYESDIPVQNGRLSLFAMAKKGQDKKKMKRIVFVIHGEGRDPWNYYSHMTSALEAAHADGYVESIDDVGIWAPSFWCNADEGVWPASELNKSHTPRQTSKSNSKLMVWEGSDWNFGSESIYPASDNGISSFTTLDDAILYFGNKAIFPNVSSDMSLYLPSWKRWADFPSTQVETIVLASHSMGAQMLHRYAQLGTQPTVGAEVHYYIGNPASYLYSDKRRPETGIGGATSRSKCAKYNEYKYGYDKIDNDLAYNSPHASGMATFATFSQRYVHYQLGTADHASATAACGAHVQGSSHLNRGRIYQAYLELLGYPENQTIDYIAGVGHDDKAMFSSKHGQYRLFVQNNSQGKTLPSSSDKTHGLTVTFTGSSSTSKREARSTPQRLG